MDISFTDNDIDLMIKKRIMKQDLKEFNPTSSIQDAFVVQEKVAEQGMQYEYTVCLHNLTKGQEGVPLWRIANATPRERAIASLMALDMARNSG